MLKQWEVFIHMNYIKMAKIKRFYKSWKHQSLKEFSFHHILCFLLPSCCGIIHCSFMIFLYFVSSRKNYYYWRCIRDQLKTNVRSIRDQNFWLETHWRPICLIGEQQTSSEINMSHLRPIKGISVSYGSLISLRWGM